MIFKNSSSGFTLVEMMVGVSLTLLITGFILTGISRYQARDKIRATTNELVSAIKLARNYAITSQRPKGYNSQLDYVAFRVTANGIITVNPVNITSGTGVAFVNKSVASQNTQITAVNFGELLFSVPDGKLLKLKGNVVPPLYDTEPQAASYSVSINITSPENDDESRTIIINSLGNVTEN